MASKTRVTLGIDPSYSSTGWAFMHLPPRQAEPIITECGQGPIFSVMPEIEKHLRLHLRMSDTVRIAVERMPSAFSMSTAVRALSRGISEHMKDIYREETDRDQISFVTEISPDKWREATHKIMRGPGRLHGYSKEEAEKVIKHHAVQYAESFKMINDRANRSCTDKEFFRSSLEDPWPQRLIRPDFHKAVDTAEAVCIAVAIGRLKGGW